MVDDESILQTDRLSKGRYNRNDKLRKKNWEEQLAFVKSILFITTIDFIKINSTEMKCYGNFAYLQYFILWTRIVWIHENGKKHTFVLNNENGAVDERKYL